MRAPNRSFLAILWSLLSVASLSYPAAAAEHPAWWADAQAEASREGYALADDAGIEALRAGGQALIVDVRPDYEFAMGHVPGAVNMEFDLGDERELSPERKRLLAALLGPVRDRAVVFYCRSFM